MSYTATIVRLGEGAWTGDDIDLAEVDDVDALIDLLREISGEAKTLILFLEEDDEYVAIVRITGDREPAVFISDRRVLAQNTVAGRVLGDELPIGDEELGDEESARPEVEPAGDATLLADLGVDEDLLITLCGEEGMLPADVIFEVCEQVGCGPVLEELRGV